MAAFTSNNGLNVFVQRLEYEVDLCRLEQPHEIEVPADRVNKARENDAEADSDTLMEIETIDWCSTPSEGEDPYIDMSLFSSLKSLCYPQRAALLKSMLNFLKKAIQYPNLSDGLRHLMYGNFPRALRHIISNAEYYGPSLFLLANDVVSVYVYNEPTFLSTLQDNGLTDVILYSLLIKDVPATKEVLASLPNVFTALCLNYRGLKSFVRLKPFERIFKIFLSPMYLQPMRRRRSDSMGDTASSLGNAMDELMRHQPSLRVNAIGAIIKLLEEICKLGTDPKYVCAKTSSSGKSNECMVHGTASGGSHSNDSSRAIPVSNINNDSSSSEEEDEYDDDTTAATTPQSSNIVGVGPSGSEVAQPFAVDVVADDSNSSMTGSARQSTSSGLIETVSRPSSGEQSGARQQIPLHEYILNVVSSRFEYCFGVVSL